MSVYKARDEAIAPAIEPTNWNPLVGGLVVAVVLVVALLAIFLVGSVGLG